MKLTALYQKVIKLTYWLWIKQEGRVGVPVAGIDTPVSMSWGSQSYISGTGREKEMLTEMGLFQRFHQTFISITSQIAIRFGSRNNIF